MVCLCRTKNRTALYVRRSHSGAALVEYLPPLLIALMIGMGAYQHYGTELRVQMAHMANKFSEYYYQSWFWPDAAMVGEGGGGSVSHGHSGGSGPSDAGSNASSGSSRPQSSTGGDAYTDGDGSVAAKGNNDSNTGNYLDSASAGGEASACSSATTAGNDPFAGGSGAAVLSAAPTFSQVGNPIDLGSGNKFQHEVDYTDHFGSSFHRYYNSVLGDTDTGIGHGWRHSYQRALALDKPAHVVTAWRDDGSQYRFTRTTSTHWLAESGVMDRLEHSDGHWLYTTAAGNREIYDEQGRLQRIDYVDGRRKVLRYGDSGNLQTVTDADGRTLTLQWHDHHLQRVDLPSGEQLRYDYDALGNLVATMCVGRHWYSAVQSFLATPERRYRYEDSRHSHALTGLYDATGERYASWRYDELGRAILSEHGKDAEKISIEYRPPVSGGAREAVVTNAAGLAATYLLETARPGKYRLRDIDGHPMIGCSAVQNHYRYDDQGFVRAVFNAIRIGDTYERNARGLVEVEQRGLRFRTDETSYPVEGSIRIERSWDAVHPWLLGATRFSWQRDSAHPWGYWEPVIRRTLTYDDRGYPLADTFKDLTERPASYSTQDVVRARTYRYQFEDDAHNRLRTRRVSDGNGHETVYRYRDGLLRSIENPLHQRMQFNRYDEDGRPLEVTLPTQQILRISYNHRGLPVSLERIGGKRREVTTAEYDAEGRIVHLVRPDSSELRYQYNAAGQLIHIENGWGESIELQPNRMTGSWEQRIIKNAAGNRVRQHQRRFNALGQLAAVLGAEEQRVAFNYDAGGDLIAVTEGAENPAALSTSHTTRARYDTRHHLLELIDAAGYSTHYSPGPTGSTVLVGDANGNATEYARNGFDEVIQENNRVTGSVINYYDANGNVVERRGKVGASIRFEYDVLNRVTKIDYPGDRHDIRYIYDQVDDVHGSGIQRLTSIVTWHQIIDFSYDELGRRIRERTSETDRNGNIVDQVALAYGYLPGDRIASIRYPNGGAVIYRYDKDRVKTVMYSHAGERQTHAVVKNVVYAAFGEPGGWAFGNGLQSSRRYDLDGNLRSIVLRTGDGDVPVWSQKYEYDRYQNIREIRRSDGPRTADLLYTYDPMDRLIDESGENVKRTYRYDALGNRRRDADELHTDYDAAGNVVRRREAGIERSYRYDASNRPIVVRDAGVVTALYRYNAQGWRQEKRTYKSGNLQRTRYVYSAVGTLFSERHDDNQTVNYIWLGSVPVAQVESGAGRFRIIYLHADHLAAPRVATDSQRRVIWRWQSDAFGNGLPDQDPDRDGDLTHVNLRFAGQYADRETGLFYNLNRYYDPRAGRYTQSDPLGQLASMNTYSYVDANPVSWLDPLGLAKLQYVLIDSFGGDPTDASKRTLKSGIDRRMLHFAAYVTDIAGRPGAGFIYDPNGIYKGLGENGAVTWSYTGGSRWDDFQSFYKSGYGGSSAFNTGDWAITYYDDAAADRFFQALGGSPAMCAVSSVGTGFNLRGPGGSLGSSGGMASADVGSYIGRLPNLPAGFYAMEHFNFPTIVHKLSKPVFASNDLPDEDDKGFHTFPWHDRLTKAAEATDKEAVTPHWPASGSGITLGRGFDLSKFSSDTSLVKKMLARAGIDNKLIIDAVGLSTEPRKDSKGKPIAGSDAASIYWNAHMNELQSIKLTAEQQYLVSLYAFEAKETNINNIPGASSGTIKLYDKYFKGKSGPDWQDLDVKIRDILFDLNYRGDLHDLSSNTKQKSYTPFDDVRFAKDFRDAVQGNSVLDLCLVMKSSYWGKNGNLWKVPGDRWKKRISYLDSGSDF